MLASRFAKYVFSGLLALAAHLLVLTVLVEGFAANPLLATCIGFCVGLTINYLIQHRWVFSAKGAHRVLAVRYVGVTLVTFALNVLLFRLAYNGLGLWYPVAQILATGVIFVINFIINLKYTFKTET